MQSSFLDYYKIILDKVSFDYQLLKKEYHKALKTLKPDEARILDEWLNQRGLPLKPIKIKARKK